MRYSWWIDVIEGELCEDKFCGVSFFHNFSKFHQRPLQQLQRLKALVREQEELTLPEDELYYRRQHKKIMAGIFKYELEKKALAKKKEQQMNLQIAKLTAAKHYLFIGL